MARLCFGLKDGSPALVACTQEIKTKIATLSPGLEQGDDIIRYVVFLANKSRKSKPQMRQALTDLFDDRSEELVNWLWTDLRDTLPKPSNSPPKETEERPNAADHTEKKRRCRHWPNCEREDCQFHHPNTPCPYFPHCRYGATCIYIHPDCKFGEACRRSDCPYTHRVLRLAEKEL